MKKLIILFCCCIGINANAQNIKLEKVADSSYNLFVNNITFFKNYKATDFQISILVVSNKSGSAMQDETDEISEKVFIGISEYDEVPNQMLYLIDNLYAPKNFFFEKKNNFGILKFKFGSKTDPQIIRLKITKDDLIFIK